MLTDIQTCEAFGGTATEQRWEPSQQDMLNEAHDHIESETISMARIATDPTYRSAIVTAFQAKLNQRDRLIDSLRGQRPATHAWGYVDHEGGNSSWTEEF